MAHHRELLGALSMAAYQTVKELMAAAPSRRRMAGIGFRFCWAAPWRVPFRVWPTAIAALLGIVGQGLYPVPGAGGRSSGLTIHGSASSPLTLKTMLAIALLGMPLVLGYTVFIYRRFRGPVVLDEASY